MNDDDENIFSDYPIGVDPTIAEKIGNKSLIKKIFRFIKKFRWLFIVFAGLIVIAGGLYLFLPEVNLGNTKVVSLGSEFKLKKDDKASLKDGSVSVKIVNFVNDDCPEGTTCFWSGQAVQYTMTINGKDYATGSVTKALDTDFDIETISSDYETYANIKIIKR
jgi:hypothetical protein